MIDLRPDHLETVKGILAAHVPACEVRAFGSRATWTAKDYSDLDLAIAGADPLDRVTLGRLQEAFEESNLPMRVDVLDWHAISHSFRDVIEQGYVVVQEREAKQTAAGEWREVRLGDVCEKIGSGATPRGGRDVYLEDGPYALIRSQNVYNNGFHRDGLAFIGETHATELKNVEVAADDVLLNITGDSVARACQVASDVLPARVNQHVAILRTDPTRLNSLFLRYFLICPETQTMLLSWAESGGTRNALTKGMIESFTIPLPPLDEQRAIAHVLGTLDDKIELNRRMNATLEAMARAVFKDWFVDFGPVRAKLEGREPYLPPEVWSLFPDRLVDSELGEIPEGWEVKALGEHFDAVKGVSYKGSGLSDIGMPLHNLNSVYEGGGYKHEGIKYYTGEYAERHVVCPGDVIVANTEQGHDRLLIGYAAIVPRFFGDRGIVSHHLFRLRPKADSAFTPAFLCHLVNSPQMHDVVSGYANGTTVNMLPIAGVQQPEIVCPPQPLVVAFDSLAAKAEQRREELVSGSRTLAAQRDALLPKLVSGEVRLGPEPTVED